MEEEIWFKKPFFGLSVRHKNKIEKIASSNDSTEPRLPTDVLHAIKIS